MVHTTLAPTPDAVPEAAAVAGLVMPWVSAGARVYVCVWGEMWM